MIVHSWSSTINRQVPEVRTKWVDILMIKSTRYTPEVRTKWVQLQQNGEYSYIWLRKLLRWLIGKFLWWNEDKNQTNCGPGYWRNPETSLELHPFYLILVNAFSNKMEANVNVLCSRVRDRILGKGHCTLVISMYCGGLSLRVTVRGPYQHCPWDTRLTAWSDPVLN